jgi:hypothetical protein
MIRIKNRAVRQGTALANTSGAAQDQALINGEERSNANNPNLSKQKGIQGPSSTLIEYQRMESLMSNNILG